MNKEKWKYFKKNNLKFAWKVYYNSWVTTLCKCKFANSLKKRFKNAERLYYKYLKLRFILTRKPMIPLLEYIVTTRCTMNCKHCNTFIPYFTSKTHVSPITFEQFKKDIDILLKSVDFIEVFGFVGGEPFLAKDLSKMVKYAVSQKQIHHVFIATNCTILPNSEHIETFKNKKVILQLSDYRDVHFTNGTTVKYLDMKKILNENKINFTHPQEDTNRNCWITMPKLRRDIQDNKMLEERFDNCYRQYSNMLCDGKLVQDTLCAYMHRNLELTKEANNEIVDIREQQTPMQLRDKIINFYAKPYSAFYHYCHFEDIKTGLPCGEQVEEENTGIK